MRQIKGSRLGQEWEALSHRVVGGELNTAAAMEKSGEQFRRSGGEREGEKGATGRGARGVSREGLGVADGAARERGSGRDRAVPRRRNRGGWGER